VSYHGGTDSENDASKDQVGSNLKCLGYLAVVYEFSATSDADRGALTIILEPDKIEI